MRTIKKLVAMLLCACLMLACGIFSVGCTDSSAKKCNHDNLIICETCGKVVLGDEFFVNYAKSGFNALGAGKGYETSSNNLVIELIIDRENAGDEEYKMVYNLADGTQTFQLIDKYIFSFDDFSVFYGFNANSELYLSIEIVAKASAYVDDAVFSKGDYTASVVIDNLYMTSSTTVKLEYPGLSDELNLINKKESSVNKDTPVDLRPMLSSIRKNDTASQDDNAIEEQQTVGELIVAAITEVIPQAISIYEDDFIAEIIAAIDENKQATNLAIAQIFNANYSVEKDDDAYIFTANKFGNKIKDINQMLDTKISVLVDQILGEGTYQNIPTILASILDMKIKDIITAAEAQGVTFDQLIAELNLLLQQVMEDETITIDAILANYLPEGTTLADYVDVLRESDLTVKEMIMTYGGVTELQISTAMLNLTAMLEQMKDCTLYDLMEVDSEKKEMISEVVEKIADFTDTAIISSVTLDKNGNLISSELKLDLDSKNEILASLLDSSKESEDAVDFKIEGTFKIVCAETPAIAE